MADSVVGSSPYEKKGSTHKATLIFLHGLGDQGAGWCQILAPGLNALGVKVICPNAATRPVTLNFGMQMPAWYDLKGLSVESPEDVEGIQTASAYVHSLITKEINAGIDPKKIAVGGFSMGGALAIYSALTFPQRIGAIIGLSSFLLQRDKIQSLCKANVNVPIFLGHGRNDFLVPYTFGQMTHDRIKVFNSDIVFRAYNCDHSSTDEEIADVVSFLKEKMNL